MGLDAYVRCRCFEEGKLKPGPVPFDDLYIDEDGYLSSKKLDAARSVYDRRRFSARYGQLEDDFLAWSENCCEHEDGEYCSEWVGNVAGVAQFQALVEQLGGVDEFPLLSSLLPSGNGGSYPVEKAAATLEELDRFCQALPDLIVWVLCDAETGDEVWSNVPGTSFTWMMGPCDRAGMDDGVAFFERAGEPRVETAHFKQVPIGAPDNRGNRRMEIICFDTESTSSIFDSIGPSGKPKVEREFIVVSKEAPFLYEGRYLMAERIRHLLEASLETGNPIIWC